VGVERVKRAEGTEVGGARVLLGFQDFSLRIVWQI